MMHLARRTLPATGEAGSSSSASARARRDGSRRFATIHVLFGPSQQGLLDGVEFILGDRAFGQCALQILQFLASRDRGCSLHFHVGVASAATGERGKADERGKDHIAFLHFYPLGLANAVDELLFLALKLGLSQRARIAGLLQVDQLLTYGYVHLRLNNLCRPATSCQHQGNKHATRQ